MNRKSFGLTDDEFGIWGISEFHGRNGKSIIHEILNSAINSNDNRIHFNSLSLPRSLLSIFAFHNFTMSRQFPSQIQQKFNHELSKTQCIRIGHGHTGCAASFQFVCLIYFTNSIAKLARNILSSVKMRNNNQKINFLFHFPCLTLHWIWLARVATSQMWRQETHTHMFQTTTTASNE